MVIETLARLSRRKLSRKRKGKGGKEYREFALVWPFVGAICSLSATVQHFVFFFAPSPSRLCVKSPSPRPHCVSCIPSGRTCRFARAR